MSHIAALFSIRHLGMKNAISLDEFDTFTCKFHKQRAANHEHHAYFMFLRKVVLIQKLPFYCLALIRGPVFGDVVCRKMFLL